jgi:predicted nuclease with TOPRIM domain
MNDVSLREYIEKILEEREKANLAQLLAAKEQLNATADALQHRLTTMNEFRSQILEERSLYVRREYLQTLSDRLDKLEKWQANVTGRQLIFGGAIIVLSGLITVALRLVGH